MTHRAILTISLCLALAGCAGTAVQARQATPQRIQGASIERGAIDAKNVCVPPGMPSYTEWKNNIVGRSGHIHGLSGHVYRAATITHEIDGKPVEGQWLLVEAVWHLVVVDPAPDDMAVPVWIDRGFLAQPRPGSDESMVLGQFGKPCSWERQITPVGRPGDINT